VPNATVRIRDLAGKPVERPFHVQVQCPSRPYSDGALVDETGSKTAGSVWSAAHIGRGQYEVYPYRDVTKCALVATSDFVDGPAHLVFPGVDPAQPTFIP
jgi:hypothetical protein